VASKSLKAAVVAVVVAVGPYWYWSPYIAMRSMQAAAHKHDADAFNQYVDYPKLRESLKGQFGARIAEVVGDAGKGESDVQRAGGALGAMLGMAMVERLIEAMVRPEFIMKSMNEAKLQDPTARGTSDPTSNAERVKWMFDRKGVDRIVAYGGDVAEGNAPKESGVGFVFDRSGFASWKLSEIRLPAKP
jgi:hypothetical protein